MKKILFKIPELDCSEECSLLEKALKNQTGIQNLHFDILHRTMEVEYDAEAIDSEEILTLIRSTGLSGQIAGGKTAKENFWQKNKRTLLCSLSGLFLLVGLLTGEQNYYLLSALLGSWFVLPRAFQSAKHFRPDINLLMVLAVIGAIGIREWVEAASVAFLFSLALLLESWSVERARKAIDALLDLTPKLARIIKKGELVEKNVNDVSIGETILVRPGEKIPLDGEITKGTSLINQAPITGESMPVSKQKGDEVFAGTINEESVLEIRVTKEFHDTTVMRIVKMVEDARKRRAKSEEWVNRFARVYTPIMLILALLFAFLPPLFFGATWPASLYSGLVLLVIACPCALVISTPVTIVSALTSAAKAGILIKGGVYLELAGTVNAIAFDKTGTITQGFPEVQKIAPLNHHSEKELLEIATKLEIHSRHPLARAILKKAQELQIHTKPADEYKIYKGLGAEGVINGTRFWIGSHRFMHEEIRKESHEAHLIAQTMEDEGHTVIAIGDFNHICGLFSLSDQIRPHVEETLTALKELGIQTIVLLTGDNQKTAELLSKKIGIPIYYAELKPEEKLAKIEELKKVHPRIAMVGDGVNDTPAMAASALGIAIAGTDAAFETADIVLIHNEIALLPWLIRHSRKAMRVIKQNIGFALGIKALFILLAFFHMTTLWMAIAADTGASILVIFNGLRLLRRN